MNMNNIVFPSTKEELRQIKDGFHSIANFPNVVGAIDGTLIPIQGMTGEDEPSFICRKNVVITYKKYISRIKKTANKQTNTGTCFHYLGLCN
jgi:hypothetical protein